MTDIIPTHQFKKQYKRVKRDPRWRPVFNGSVPFDTQHRSPWDYIINSFIKQKAIPEYFYPHLITPSKKIIQQLKRRVSFSNINIKVIELHFDGHNGNHLLIYSDVADYIYLLAIGTHNDLF